MTRGKLSRDDVEHFMENELYIPTRTIWIGPTVDDDSTNALMAERAIKNLHILDSKSDDDIVILMLNYGGEVIAGMAIYDAIQVCRSHVTIKVFGCASSMGSIILQAADKRLLSPNAEIMIHYGSECHDSNHPKIVKAARKRNDEYDAWMKNLYLKKIKQKKPDFTPSQLEKLLDFDTYFTPQRAIEYGLADGILEIFKGHKD